MRYLKIVAGILACALMTRQVFSRADEPTIRSSVITSGDLPAVFDSTRTFHYVYPAVNPESLLTVLWKANVRVSLAWLPLDNMCMSPIGPQFTVELESEDSAILDFDFAPGNGRLRCATRLKRFVVSD